MYKQINRIKIINALPYLFYLSWYILFSIKYFSYAGPDFTAYISIANKYLHGHLFEAVNGWWSPFYSWALAFLKLLGMPDLLANKSVNFIFGLMSIFFTIKIIRLFTTTDTNKYSSLYILIVAPAMAYYGAVAKSPDFLVTVIILSSAYYMILFLLYKRKIDAIILGCIGGFAYYIKTYNFYYFIVYFIFFDLLLIVITGSFRKNILLLTLKWSIFLFLTLLWAFAIYSKYHVKKVSLIRELKVCTDQPFSVGNIMYCTGLLPPPDSVGFSGWDDPSNLPSKKSLFSYTFDKSGNKIIFKYFSSAWSFIRYQFGLWKFILLIGSAIVLFKRNRIGTIVLSGTFLIFISGYFFIYLEERFVSAAIILGLSMIGIAFMTVVEKLRFRRWVEISFLILLIGLFAKAPAFFLFGKEQTEILQIDNLLSRSTIKLPANKKFAASNEVDSKAFFLPFEVKGTFYGFAEKDIPLSKLYKDLKKYQIDYFITGKILTDTSFLKPVKGFATSPLFLYEPRF